MHYNLTYHDFGIWLFYKNLEYLGQWKGNKNVMNSVDLCKTCIVKGKSDEPNIFTHIKH